MAFYYTEIREEWCIQYLDIDPDKANENLDDEIEQYPELKEGMAKLNKIMLILPSFVVQFN